MEFVQFHPTGMVWPSGVAGLLVTEAVRAEGGILRERRGRALHGALRPGEDGALDAGHRLPGDLHRDPRGPGHRAKRCLSSTSRTCPPRQVKVRLPSMYAQFLELAGVDITKEPMQVAPTCHYMMGGIRVDADTAATSVPGLYAAGECSGGMSGATRLGGNSLSDLLVFGRRAGAAAAEHAKAARRPGRRPRRGRGRRGGDDRVPRAARATSIPTSCMPISSTRCRPTSASSATRPALAAAVDEIEALKERARNLHAGGTERRFNPGWHPARTSATSSSAPRRSRAPRYAHREPRGAQPARLPGALRGLGRAQPGRDARTGTRCRSSSGRS